MTGPASVGASPSMEGSSVTAYAPGSVGNVVCGFDVLGLALERPGDRVTARPREDSGVVIASVTGDEGRIPTDPERNSASVAVAALLDRAGVEAGVELSVEKGLPLSGGMGGSAASAVAGALAVDALLGLESSSESLLEAALEGERVAAGSAHADNVGPSLLGGIVLARSSERRRLVRLPVPEGLSVALLHPHVELPTSEARAVLPERVPLEVAVQQWGDTAALVAGLYRNDWDLISDALEDRIAEPVRGARIPAFAEMRLAALEAGALGFGISGAGPSVVALCRSTSDARRAGEALLEAFRGATAAESEADVYAGPVPERGARIVDPPGEEAA